MTAELTYHKPALPRQTADTLVRIPDGVYADATLGGGGHARFILERLGPKGVLFCVDQDPEAWPNLPQDPRARLLRGNFSDLKELLAEVGCDTIDGALADLGVSFHQFDAPERGFSYRFDAPLDMRMNPSEGITAEQLLAKSPPEEIARILRAYGEIRNAGRIARTLKAKAERGALRSTFELNDALEAFAPRSKEYAFFAQVYQAFRIAVNKEMEALESFLAALPEVLKPGGVAVVISYHSLEDRLVKNYFRSGNFTGEPERDFYGASTSPFEPLFRKPVVPGAEEIADNSRARSARLRAAIFNPRSS